MIFRGDLLISSLSGSPRAISPIYYHDDTGSELYERLCEEELYYLFRDEKSILATHARALRVRRKEPVTTACESQAVGQFLRTGGRAA
ncbi:L-histidine N(alpha)-methyltransferase [Mesorhizobium captivum]|uniref:L-histidine N(alpha)-methyltransferase n=1 Tax=Mesorhizobium captivum TaxID=3072319 RepID=UPI003D3242D7